MKKSITNYLEQTAKKYKNKLAFIENKENKITYNNFIKETKIIASNILEKKELYNEPIAIYI